MRTGSLLVLSVLLWTTPAAGAATPAATPPRPADRIKALPRRPTLRRQRIELTPAAALTLNDGFTLQGLAGGTAQLYLREDFAVGLGADWLFARLPLENTRTLRQIYFSVPAPLQRPVLLAQGFAAWTVLAGKVAAGRQGLAAIDLYVAAGGGIATAFDGRTPLAGFVALGQHYILSDGLALRFELRDALYVARSDDAGRAASRLQQLVTLSAGVSFLVPGEAAAAW